MTNFTRTIEIEATRKAGKKSFSATISTETPVRRRDWERGEFLEVLSHKEGAIDLSRAPLPLLESHNQRTLPIGIVDNLRIVDGKLKGEVGFGASARAKEIEADVEAGIIRNLSVGYSIEKTAEKTSGSERTITATRWTPHEVSAVAVPADAGAGFGRSATTPTARSQTMSRENENETNRDTPELIERQRCSAITAMTRYCDLEPEVAEDLIGRGLSLDEARDVVIRLRGERRQRENPVERMVSHTRHARDEHYTAIHGSQRGDGDDFQAAATDALLMRAGIRVRDAHPAAGDVSPSLIDVARTCISRAGKTVRGNSTDLLMRTAMATSDFPSLLSNVMGKALRIGYQDEPASHRLWVRETTVRDFKTQTRPILGSAPELEQVNEGGEYQWGPMTEDSTSYAIAKFGRIVELTFEALVNDDLDSFARIKAALGQRARQKEADLVYALFAENSGDGPTMSDTKALFHDDHGNIVPDGDMDAASLAAARTLLRRQTALGGGYLSLIPRFLIISPEFETDAEILLASATKHVTQTTESDTPKWLSGLTLVVDPRLDDEAYYLAADNAQIDTAECGRLEENASGPTFDEENGFERDVHRWKIRHTYGVKFLDYRGMTKVEIASES